MFTQASNYSVCCCCVCTHMLFTLIIMRIFQWTCYSTYSMGSGYCTTLFRKSAISVIYNSLRTKYKYCTFTLSSCTIGFIFLELKGFPSTLSNFHVSRITYSLTTHHSYHSHASLISTHLLIHLPLPSS